MQEQDINFDDSDAKEKFEARMRSVGRTWDDGQRYIDNSKYRIEKKSTRVVMSSDPGSRHPTSDIDKKQKQCCAGVATFFRRLDGVVSSVLGEVVLDPAEEDLLGSFEDSCTIM